MIAALRLGTLYFGAVFAVGFVLGAIRTVYLIPWIDEVWAVLAELPVILTVAWVTCGRLLRGGRLTVTEAAVMGATAFILLMIAETVVSVLLSGRTLARHFALYAEPAHGLGVAGQLAFAVFPLLRR